MQNHDVTSNLGSAKVCSFVISETYFFYDKHICIAATDYHINKYFYFIVLFPLTAILQLINFTASNFYVVTLRRGRTRTREQLLLQNYKA